MVSSWSSLQSHRIEEPDEIIECRESLLQSSNKKEERNDHSEDSIDARREKHLRGTVTAVTSSTGHKECAIISAAMA